MHTTTTPLRRDDTQPIPVIRDEIAAPPQRRHTVSLVIAAALFGLLVGAIALGPGGLMNLVGTASVPDQTQTFDTDTDSGTGADIQSPEPTADPETDTPERSSEPTDIPVADAADRVPGAEDPADGPAPGGPGGRGPGGSGPGGPGADGPGGPRDR